METVTDMIAKDEPLPDIRKPVVEELVAAIAKAVDKYGSRVSCAEMLSAFHVTFAHSMNWTKQNSTPEHYAANLAALRTAVQALMMDLTDTRVM